MCFFRNKDTATNKRMILYYFIIATFLAYGCNGSNGASSEQESSYGSLKFALDFKTVPTTNSRSNAIHTRSAPAPNICDDYGVDTILMEVIDVGGKSVADASWECYHHSGKIDQIMPGSGYAVICKGRVRGELKWQGVKEQVNIIGGQTTNLDTIAMHYIGDDTSAPSLSYSLPEDGAVGTFLNTSIITVFDEPLAASSIPENAIKLSVGGSSVAGEIEFHSGNNALYFKPLEALKPFTTYSVNLDAVLPDGIGITDEAGNVSSQVHKWEFTTGDSMDNQPPEVTATVPPSGADGVDPYASIRVTFSESLNPAALKKGLFAVASGETIIDGSVAYDNPSKTLIFTPYEPLSYLTDYVVTIQTGVVDLSQNLLAEPPFSWAFSTMETQYALSIGKQGAGTGIITSIPSGIDCGSICEGRFNKNTQISLQAEPDIDSRFDGWSEPSCNDVDCNIEIQQDTTLIANFSLKNNTIHAVSNSGGSINPSGKIVIDYDKGVRFEFVADQGYYFSELRVDGQSLPPSEFYEFSNIREDHTIDAIFKPMALVDPLVSESGNGRTWDTAFKSI